MKSYIVLISILVFSNSYGATPTENKKIVRSFYETAFIKQQPALAMKNFVGPTYTQHNPHVNDGPQPFIEYFSAFYKNHPNAKSTIKRMVAEGDLVVVHAHSQAHDKDLGYAAIDIFRLENGKIVEHWDSVQAVPEKSANTNTMF
jgi:predicted SnoaL-like aldol condensation-catalyzing enzyme